MKSKEEIEYLAANLANPNVCKTTNWIEGYTQCQEDMTDKKYTEQDVQNVLDGFTNEAPGEYIKTNFIGLLNKQK